MPFIEGVPTVTLELDKARVLGFTAGSIRRLRERFGGLQPDLTGPDGKIDAGKVLPVLPVYIWACLDAEGRAQLTPDQIEDMLHPNNLLAVAERVAELFTLSNPEASADAGPTEAPGPKLAATG